MKHTKKKKRPRSSKQASRQNAAPGGGGEEREIVNSLMEGVASVSINGEANENSNKAEDQITTCSSSSGSLGSTSSSSGNLSNCGNCNRVGEKMCKSSSRSKKVIAATGMVSSVLGKEYVSWNRRKDVPKWKGWSSDAQVSNEDAEQFLCSMLSDECELGMATVKDVLCQSGYDIEKALDVLLDLTASSCEPSKGGQYRNFNTNNREDTQSFLESSDSLTDKASDSTSHSSESDLQDDIWSMGRNGRNYIDVLTGSGAHPSSGLRNLSELPQEVLESLFNTPKSSKHEPSNMNWRNVVRRIESFGHKLDCCPSKDADEKQLAPGKGDDYQVFRSGAREHWDSMKSYYQKAATAYSNGKREYAGYLSEQGRVCNKMAREADEKASHNIFNSRNKSIENVITIDLHGQHVKQAMKLLKLHLLFGAYVRSVRLFRVITGCGSHGLGKSKLKQSVVDLIEKEGIEWREENRGTLLIKLEEQREFSFLDSESDTE